MSYYKGNVGSVKCLPSFSCLVHTTTVKGRYKDLKGMAAYVIPTSDLAFSIPEDLHHSYRMAGSSLAQQEVEKKLTEHFEKLFEKYEITWIRAMHNPNIAFVDANGVGVYGSEPLRKIVAMYYMKTLTNHGYSVERGITR